MSTTELLERELEPQQIERIHRAAHEEGMTVLRFLREAVENHLGYVELLDQHEYRRRFPSAFGPIR